MRPRVPGEVQLLVAALDDAFSRSGWHGPTLRATLRRVDAREAARHARGAAHSIAEIALHCAYWKYAGHRRITGAKRGAFPWKGSNWFPLHNLTTEEWKEVLRVLESMHAQLREAVLALPKKTLADVSPGAKVSNFKLIQGLAAHDAYHAGQIRLLRGLHKRTSGGRA